MEETLGKRIAAHRRSLGLTQDRLAELLGVTAQAVSKWENDQSCPDIAMLPKLAGIFSCTTDELLGMERAPVREAELVTTPPQEPGETGENHFSLEVEAHPGRKTNILIALWVLLTGALLFNPHGDLWGVLWRSGLLVFGLGGLWPNFSFFRLACALFGGYALAEHLMIFPSLYSPHQGRWIFPTFLLLFGLYLMAKAFRKSGKAPAGHILHPHFARERRCDMSGEAFDCATSFGENTYRITLPRLSQGKGSVSFGAMTVDLSGCEAIGENCALDLGASFGELTLLIPKRIRAVPDSDTAFGNVEVVGSPAPDAMDTIHVKCDASFGQITLKYL